MSIDEDSLIADSDVDLTACDREPIHLPGSIQPHGGLLAADLQTGEVLLASANCEAWTGRAPSALMGASLNGVMAEICPEWSAPVAETDSLVRHLRTHVHGRADVDVVSHDSGDFRVVEFEAGGHAAELLEVNGRLEAVLSAVQACMREEELYRRVPPLLAELIGFDRVMIYLFGPEGHGSVVGEHMAAPAESYLGLHYPATDIPLQARRLYVLNRVRGIVDSHAEPVPLVGIRGASSLNMAFCQTRSVSPIHMQYLRNMGVRASFSASLVDGDQLSGLIACHHGQPLHLPYTLRSAIAVCARAVSDRLLFLREARAHETERARHAAQLLFLRHFILSNSPLEALRVAGPDALAMVGADAFIVLLDGGVFELGEAEVVRAWRPVVEHARDAGPVDIIATNSVASAYPELAATDADLPGGMLLVPVAERGVIAWLRAERIREVRWAGEPPERDGTKALTPRSSFEAWTERVRGTSVPWQDIELEVARILRRTTAQLLGQAPDTLQTADEILLRMVAYIQQLEVANARLRRSNEDLEQFAYAASHDLRAPLRTVKGYADLIEDHLQTDGMELPPAVAELWRPISDGVDNMSSMLDGLLEFARLGQVELNLMHVELDAVLEVVHTSLQRRIDETGASVTWTALPAVHGSRPQLVRLFQNLVENAIKYGRDGVPPVVHIDGLQEGGGVRIEVHDNGRGIPANLQERVFLLFRRAHPHTADGTGVGLALSRRIMERHGGTIHLHSEVGSGSTFELFFPSEPPP